MHFFSLDRGIIVTLCFVVWIGAAGLVCWALVPKALPDEVGTATNPASVVRAEPAGLGVTGSQVSVAQR